MSNRNRGESAPPPSDQNAAAGKGRWNELLDVAVEVFYERGYRAATMQEIADRFGVLKGSLYHYITTKEDLLIGIMERAHNRNRAFFEELRTSAGPPLERIRTFVRANIEQNMEILKDTTVYFTEFRWLSKERHSVMASERDSFEMLLRDMIEEARVEGYIRPDVDAKLASFAIFGMVNWIYSWYRPGGDHTPDEIADAVADMAVASLMSPSGSGASS